MSIGAVTSGLGSYSTTNSNGLLGLLGSLGLGTGTDNMINGIPMLPTATDENANSNPGALAMREAEMKEKAAAIRRKQQNQTVFTSPLGATAPAAVAKKQLLGA